MLGQKKWKAVLWTTCVAAMTLTTSAEPLPSGLTGSWRVTRILPTTNVTCWTTEQAKELIGSTLVYGENAMRWKQGEVPLQDIFTRNVTAAQFLKENGGGENSASFAQLGIHSARVLEVDLQHEDADITGATTEVPGDSVLLASPNRIVVSACGVYFEATRAAGMSRVQARR